MIAFFLILVDAILKIFENPYNIVAKLAFFIISPFLRYDSIKINKSY